MFLGGTYRLRNTLKQNGETYDKMDIDNIEKLHANIISIWKDGAEIDLRNVRIDKVTHMYSNTKLPVYRFFIDNAIVTKNNTNMCKYKCITCNREQIVALNNILRKMNNNIVNCYTCRNLDEQKIEKHKKTLVQKKQYGVSCEKTTLIERLQIDEIIFEQFDDDFKDNYFRKHLTSVEFEYLRPKIISFQNNKFKIDTFEYKPCVSISNQTRFCPYMYDTNRDCLEKIQYIEYKCDACGVHFKNRDLFIQKNRIKIYCQECNLTNNIFKIRTVKNCNNLSIMYQSKYELKFIRWCNENNIIVENGPKLEYIWNDKLRTYRVDFIIKKKNLLIEIKDNHVWHKEQIDNGKWIKKENCARKYCVDNHMNYEIIFPKRYVEVCKRIIKEHEDIV